MGILDGQPVSAGVTNPAFINKNIDDIDPSILGFANTMPVSGLSLNNIQQEKNSIDSFIGRVRNTAATATPPWTHNDVGTSIDPLFQRLDDITFRFSGSTAFGHRHSGVDGDGAPIDTASISNNPPFPNDVGGIGITGTSASFAFGDHQHRGIHSIAVSGSTAIYGDMAFIAGSGVELSQLGQFITISATGAGGGTGGTGKNYLTTYLGNPGNGNFELGNTTGWSKFVTTTANGAPTGAITPTSGGSISTFHATQSVVLAGDWSLETIANSGYSNGDGFVSGVFDIDIEDQAKVMGISFFYKANTNPQDVNFSGTVNNTFAVAVYDVTNSVWIQPQGSFNMVQSHGVGFFSGTFQTTANSTQYRLAVVCVNSTPGASTSLIWDDFNLGPQHSPFAPAVSDWQAYTPTFTNFGTVSGIETYWRRVGDSVEVKGNFTTGTIVSGEARMGLPPGLVADSSKIPALELSGVHTRTNAMASASDQLLLIEPGVGYFTFGRESTSLGGYGKLDASNFSNNEEIGVFGRCPVAGWSSNSVASSDTDTRVVESTVGYSGSTSLVANDPVPYDTSFYDTHSGWTLGVSAEYKIPVSGFYQIDAGLAAVSGSANLTLVKNGTPSTAPRYIVSATVAGLPSKGSAVVYCNAGDTLQFQVDNSITLGGGTDTDFVSIFRLSGPAVITATDTVAQRYTSGNGAGYNSGDTLIYETKDFDSTGSYDDTTGIFTSPVSGKYRIYAAINSTQVSHTAGQLYSLIINKNGSGVFNGKISQIVVSSSQYVAIDVEATLNLLAGDEVTVTLNGTTSLALVADNGFNEFTVARIGN